MAPPKTVRGTSVLVAALLSLTGCTWGQGTVGSSTPTGATSSATSSTSPPSIPIETVQTFKLGKRRSGYLAVTPKAAFISVSPRGGDRPSQLLRLGLSSGKQTVVAGSRWKSGEINSVAASGTWLVWVDQSDVLSTGGGGGSGAVLWRVWAKNLNSGRQILLDSSGTAASPDPPPLVSGDGYIGWTDFDFQTKGALPKQMVWKVGKAHSQTVPLNLSSKRLEHFSGASAIADGKLIFDLAADTRLGRNWGAGDCWSYPIDGKGKAQQLTHSGLVQWCRASGSSDLVWTEQSAHPKNSDAKALKTMSLDGASEPRTIHEGHMWARPLVGDGFALWFSGKPTNVSALRSTASTSFDGGDWVWQGAAGGQLVAYPGGSKKVTVTVIKVAVSNP